jgi:hypothetical protein
MTLIDQLYAGTEGLDDPEAVFGGMQSMPDPTGGTEIQNGLGQSIGSIQDGVIDGQDTVHGEHGGFEGFIEENPMGGKTYLDENGHTVTRTQDGAMGQDAVYSADGSHMGTVGPDGMGGEELTDSMGNEIASSHETVTGHEIEFGGAETASFEGGVGMEGTDLTGLGDAGDAASVGDVGDVGDLGDAADVADLEGLSDVGDLSEMV